MTPAETDLARRLAEHPRWRWMRGMRAISDKPNAYDPCMTILDAESAQGVGDGHWHEYGATSADHSHPDLTDPATCGCLLARLLDVVGGVGVGRIIELDMRWKVRTAEEPDTFNDYDGDSLGFALASALLDAWGTP